MKILDFFRRKKTGSSEDRTVTEETPQDLAVTAAVAQQALAELRSVLRTASVAEIGGFRPPEDPCASWFGRAVGAPGETLPVHEGEPMFPLLQVNVAELPHVPPQLDGIALFVLFHKQGEHPFDQPHGAGWEIREYSTLEGLTPLPDVEAPLRPFPIRWTLVEDDAPGWEDAGDLIDQGPFLKSDELDQAFFDDFSRYSGTKIGGFPSEIQHGVGLNHFVFQVGSEEKARWMWVDDGIGYFFRHPDGEWSWSCQFY